jgi:uncharacterized membrane protein
MPKDPTKPPTSPKSRSATTERHKEASTASQKTIAHQRVAQSFSGPLPPPEVLARYDKLHPGFAERILTMAEREQDHRHQCERGALSQEIRNHEARNQEAFRGQLFGLTIGSLAIISGSITAALGAQWPGGFIGGGGVIGLVAVFILGHRKQSNEHHSDEGN